MEPFHFVLLGLAGVVLAVGVQRARRTKVRTFDDALLGDVKRALEKAGFTIESYEHAPGSKQLATRALGVRLDDRVVGTLAHGPSGAVSVSLVVHGMKDPQMTFRVGRDRKQIARGSEVDIDAAFDERHKVNGAPDDAVRALLTASGPRAAVEALFAIDDVTEARLLQLGAHGGAVRVELALPRARLDGMGTVAACARALADAIEGAR